MYQYNARVVSVHDGDSVTLDVDLGFGVWKRGEKFRLYGPDPNGKQGMNAPEMNTPEGRAARDYLIRLLSFPPLPTGTPTTIYRPLVVFTVKDEQEKYGRYLAVIGFLTVDGFNNVNRAMVDAGHAVLRVYAPGDGRA
jgi:micrococcal nuclease